MPNDSVIHAIAGAAGGAVAMTATYPLLFISTKASFAESDEDKSILETVYRIVKKEGITRFYDGLGPGLLGNSIGFGLYYFFFESVRDIILKSRSGSKALTTGESMLAGAIAGSCNAVLTNPLWVVQNTQINKKPGQRLGILESIRIIYKETGFAGFLRGVGPALVMVSNPIIQYTVFEQLKNLIIRSRTAKLRAATGVLTAVAVLSDLDYFVLGAISKMIATFITYPLNLVKTRLQGGAASARSAARSLVTIAQNEGIPGLYRGVSSKLLQTVLASAILFAGQKRFYEITKKALSSVPKAH